MAPEPAATLLWIPRYWPAVGGAELHSRRLALELARDRGVGVWTHSRESGRPLALDAAYARPGQWVDGTIRIHRAGLAPGRRAAMQLLAHAQRDLRLLRPLHDRLFRAWYGPAARQLAAGYGLIHAIYNGLTASAELAADTARALGRPFVWTPLSCTDGPLAGAWSTRRFRRLYQRANALVALTDHERDWLVAQGAPAERVHVCPVGPLVECSGPEDGHRPLDLPGRGPVVLFLGRITRDKGAGRLLDAAPAVWARRPDARFLFVGPAEPVLRARFGKANDPRLIHLESVSAAEKCSALAQCALLCLPSRSESLGVVLLEAWHHARPVVACDLPVLREIVRDGENGLLVDHAPAAVARGILHLLDAPALGQRMGRAGRRRVAADFQWSGIGARMRAIHAAAAAHHRGG